RGPPGAAQPARHPQAGLPPGADPGHSAARRAGRVACGAAGTPGAHSQAARQAPGRPAVPDELPGLRVPGGGDPPQTPPRARRPPGPGIRRLPVVLPVRSFLNPEATALSEQDRYNYDWSGFRFAVSPRRLRGTGQWQCYMLVRGHGVWRPARVHTPVPGPAERPRPRQVAPGLRFGARWAGLGLNVAVWRLGAMLAAVDWQD